MYPGETVLRQILKMTCPPYVDQLVVMITAHTARATTAYPVDHGCRICTVIHKISSDIKSVYVTFVFEDSACALYVAVQVGEDQQLHIRIPFPANGALKAPFAVAAY